MCSGFFSETRAADAFECTRCFKISSLEYLNICYECKKQYCSRCYGYGLCLYCQEKDSYPSQEVLILRQKKYNEDHPEHLTHSTLKRIKLIDNKFAIICATTSNALTENQREEFNELFNYKQWSVSSSESEELVNFKKMVLNTTNASPANSTEASIIFIEEASRDS